MKNKRLKIARLSFLVIAVVVMITCSIFALSVNPFISAEAEMTSGLTLTVSGVNIRKMDGTSMNVAYPSGDNLYVEFKITLSETVSHANLTEVSFGYSTFDITATSTSAFNEDGSINSNIQRDYTPESGTLTFASNRKYKTSSDKKFYESSITVRVTVNATDFGLFDCGTSWVGNTVDTNTVFSSVNYNTTNGNLMGYLGRYFGFKLYDVPQNVYVNYGDNEKATCAYGACRASSYIPYSYCSTLGSNAITYYLVHEEIGLSNLTSLRNSPKTSSVSIKVTELGSRFSQGIIQNGLGHYYFFATGQIEGKDLWQADSQVGLWYSNYKTELGSNSLNYDQMELDRVGKMGIAVMEMDGYPSGEYFDFSCYANGDLQQSNSEIEWSDDSYQFEKYRSFYDARKTLYHYENNGDYAEKVIETKNYTAYAYRVLGDPEQIGVSGRRWDDGDNRYLYNLKLYLFQDDDVPISIENFYIDDDTKSIENNMLSVRVRFNEPVQVLGGAIPKITAKINGTGLSNPTVDFTYSSGSGTDTLVFTTDLTKIDYDSSAIRELCFSYMYNYDAIKDFSGTRGLGTGYYKDAGISKTTKAKNTQWDLSTVYYAKDGRLQFGNWEVSYNIDLRKPDISKISDSNPNESKKQHTITIEFPRSQKDVEKTMYYEWSEDMDLSTNGVINHPNKYLSTVGDTNGNYLVYNDTMTGTRYLWVKVVTTFGYTDERLFGPIYFDNTADGISSIRQVTAEYNTAGNFEGYTELSTDSPSKNKTYEVIISHEKDYRSASSLMRVDLLWSQSSPWSENTTIYINNNDPNGTDPMYIASRSQNVRTQMIKTWTTIDGTESGEATAHKLKVGNVKITDKNSINESEFWDGNKMEKYVKKYVLYITVGYDKALGYNDFNLKEGEFKKVYLGFSIYDSILNVKDYTDSEQYINGKDYIGDRLFNFDMRDTIVSSITYTGSNYLNTKNITDTDMRVFLTPTFNAKNGLTDNPLSIRFDFDLNDQIPAQRFLTNDHTGEGGDKMNYQIVVDRPSSTYKVTDFTFEKKYKYEQNDNGDYVFDTDSYVKVTDANKNSYDGFVRYNRIEYTDGSYRDRIYTSDLIKDATIIQDTKWFTFKLIYEPNSKKYVGIEITFKNKITKDEIVDGKNTTVDYTLRELSGYYGITFLFNDSSASEEVTKTTQTIEFYLATGDEETVNLGENTDASYSYDVYRLARDTEYYYKDKQGNLRKELYASAGNMLTMSSRDKMVEYLTYMEYQDLYLVSTAETISNYKDIISMVNSSLAQGESMATPNQYWIRYKASGWSYDNNTEYRYYYYGETKTLEEKINVLQLTNGLNTVINAVVTYVMKNVTNTQYVTLDGLDITYDYIHYGTEHYAETKTLSPICSGTADISFNDAGIKNVSETVIKKDSAAISKGTVFINRVFRLDSGTSYYYHGTGNSIISELYTTGSGLTFSSRDKMKEYLTFLEYQDFYLYYINSQTDADALNSSTGGFYKADGEKEAQKGEYWIRYKASGWVGGSNASKSTTYWKYYYYTTGSGITSINLSAISANITKAVDSVVERIITNNAKSVLLTGSDNLDANGAPMINKVDLRVNAETSSENKIKTTKISLSYGGDVDIYDSEVGVTDASGQENYYLLASTVTITFGSYTNLFIRPIGEQKFGKVSANKNIILKDVIDDVLAQINGTSSGSTVASSGAYELLEIDEYGARTLEVYIDLDAPQIHYVFKKWESSYNEENDAYENIVAEQAMYSISDKALISTFEGYSFTLTGIGAVGRNKKDKEMLESEIDKYAYIAVYQGATLIASYSESDFANGETYELTNGTYTLDVHDRSGNTYKKTLVLTSTEMNINFSTSSDGFSFNIKNRSAEEIPQFYVEYNNNKEYDTEFRATKSYSESGVYKIYIRDVYGYTYYRTHTYQRVVPAVTWKSKEGTGGMVTITEDSVCAKLQQLSSTQFRVVSSVPVGFEFKMTDGIKYEFIGDAPEYGETRNRIVSVSQYTTSEFKVKFYYESYPTIYSIFEVVNDVKAPEVDVTYTQYSYEDEDMYDILYQLKRMDQSALTSGQVLIPGRIDYSIVGSTLMSIINGSTVSTTEADLAISDDTGIKSVSISLNGVEIYYGPYVESGNYDDDINHNKLQQMGDYIITAYDLLGNATTFTFTNNAKYDVSYYVDDELIKDSIDKVTTIDEKTGNEIISEWRFAQKFQAYDDKGNKVDSVTEGIVVGFDKNSPNMYLRNKQIYEKVEYGNSNQIIKLSRDARIEYLLTDNDGNCKFIGLEYIDGSLYFFQYQVSIIENSIINYKKDANGNIVFEDGLPVQEGNPTITYTYTATDYVFTDAPIITIGEKTLGASIYKFDSDLDVNIFAYFENGYLCICTTIEASSEASSSDKNIGTIKTIETKVSAKDNSYETAYFKTQLSLVQTDDVDIKTLVVDDQGITLENTVSTAGIGPGEIIYSHGVKLFVDYENYYNLPVIEEIKMAYADVFTFTDYYYLYKRGTTLTDEEKFDFTDFKEGYYCIIITNIYGNDKIYFISVSNSLQVTCIATYLDESWTLQYPETYEEIMTSNYRFEVLFNSSNVTTTVEKLFENNYVPDKNFIQTVSGKTKTLTFTIIDKETDQGQYRVTLVDEFGNKIERVFILKQDTFALNNNTITGWNEKALRKVDGYTNQILSIDKDKLFKDCEETEGLLVKFISVTKKNGEEVILFDQISRDKVQLDETKLQNCIGLLGDGEYIVKFRDKYGNLASVSVFYSGTPTLILSRMTSTGIVEEEYGDSTQFGADKAQSIGFWSNNSLRFSTTASTYYMTIDTLETRCPRLFTFTTDSTTGTNEMNVYYIDEYGFEYNFVAHLYRTTLEITPSSTVTLVDIDGANFTNNNVAVDFEGIGATCTYLFNNETTPISYKSGEALRKDGTYRFTVVDYAGNEALYSITKDTVVKFSFTEGQNGDVIKNGFLTASNNVIFNALDGDTSYFKKVFHNQKYYDSYGLYSFTEDGLWEFIVADKVGNETNFMFYIITHDINYLDYTAPQDYVITNIWYLNEDGRTSMNSLVEKDSNGDAKRFVFEKEGSYTMIMTSKINSYSSTFSLNISTEKPTAKLAGCVEGEETINNIKFTDTVAGDKIFVYKNGQLVSTYEVIIDGESVEISEEGEYTIVIQNIAGNTVEYHFTRKHVANTAGSVLILVLLVVLAIAFFVGLLYRNRSKVDK